MCDAVMSSQFVCLHKEVKNGSDPDDDDDDDCVCVCKWRWSMDSCVKR